MNVFQNQSKTELIENIESMLRELPVDAEFQVKEETVLLENPHESNNS